MIWRHRVRSWWWWACCLDERGEGKLLLHQQSLYAPATPPPTTTTSLTISPLTGNRARSWPYNNQHGFAPSLAFLSPFCLSGALIRVLHSFLLHRVSTLLILTLRCHSPHHRSMSTIKASNVARISCCFYYIIFSDLSRRHEWIYVSLIHSVQPSTTIATAHNWFSTLNSCSFSCQFRIFLRIKKQGLRLSYSSLFRISRQMCSHVLLQIS